MIEWLEAFLTNRKQRLRIQQTSSNWATVISGIPQGSVLGRILFIIYLNDLVEYCNSGSIIFLFADDAKIFLTLTRKKIVKSFQQDLDKSKEWMDTWLLSLNVGKCKSAAYSRTIDFSNKYKMSDNAIEQVEQIKDLGLGSCLILNLNLTNIYM